MFLPNSHSFLLVRSVKPVIHPVRSSLAEVSLETRAFGASETSNEIQESATSLSSSSSSDSGRKVFSPPHLFTRRTFANDEINRKIGVGVYRPHQNFWHGEFTPTPMYRCGGLPNTDSFLLVRRPIVESDFTPEAAAPLSHPQSTDLEQSKVNDQGKRTFLKVAGVAGAGIIASLLLPKKTEALIMGSSPTTGVVGVKNAANTRINPATQETASLLLKTSDLTFDTGSLQVKVTSLPDSSFSDSGGVAKKGLVDVDRHVQVDVLSSALPTTASTETTLQTISFGGKKYALKMTTVGSVDYVAEADTGTATSAALWRAKKVDSTTGILITWADGNANFDNSATDLTALTYS